MDNVSKETRSRVMAAVRSSGNHSTEVALMTLLKESGLTGWRRKWKLRGQPDFVWPKQRLALFVDGCFWHGCPKHCRIPASNEEYWERKLSNNRVRDRSITRELRKAGWTVLRVWEHALKDFPSRVIARIRKALQPS